jgi:hypothetical protein
MAASLQIEVAPAVEPVSLTLAKSHLRVNISTDDALITLYIQAARELVEGYVSRSFVNKGYRQDLDAFPYYIDTANTAIAAPPSYASLPRYATTQWNYSQLIKLLISPLVSVESIDYTKPDGTIGTLKPALVPWRAGTIYAVGAVIQDPNGNAQKVTAAVPSAIDGSSKSGLAVPTWNITLGQATTDGDLTWTNQGAAPAGDFVVDIDSEPPRIFPMPGKNWPACQYSSHAVRIHFTAGYGNAAAAAFPAVAKLAMLQAVANWYENRESVTDATLKQIPLHFEAMLWSIRVLDFSPTPG